MPEPTLTMLSNWRLSASQLVKPVLPTPEATVRWFGGVQCQDYAGAKWAIAMRTQRCTDADVEAAFQTGRILRTHVLRPTWHFVCPSDIRWLLELTAPRVRAVCAYHNRRLNLNEKAFTRSQATLKAALQNHNFLDREGLRSALTAAKVPCVGEQLSALLMRAELDGLICSGPREGKQFTYALLEERVPLTAPLPPSSALSELARRYFQSHGPARVADFAWWSGLTLTSAKRAIAQLSSDLIAQETAGEIYYRAASASKPRSLASQFQLLANFDEFLVGYTDHSFVLDPQISLGNLARDQVLGNSIILRAGRLIGSWRRALKSAGVLLEARLFTVLTPAEKTRLEKALQRYAAFLGLSAQISFTRG